MTTVRAYAPASIGNFAAGFDLMGGALAPLDGLLLGDVVTARIADRPDFTLTGPYASGLAGEARPNLVLRTAARYAEVLAAMGRTLPPLAITLEKRLPLASGLGSSASSIVATLVALQALAGGPLGRTDLLALGAELEGCYGGGPHGDNIAACLLGGLQLLVEGREGGLAARSLPWPSELLLVVAHPHAALSTAQSRAVLPEALPRREAVGFAGNLAGFVHALHAHDGELLARCLRDPLAEPHRARLVPGFRAAQAGARAAGALGCSLSGSGPSVFAVAAEEDAAAIRSELVAGFAEVGVACDAWTCGLDLQGARLLEDPCAS